MILVSDKAHVRTITLNRPDAMNAFNGALFDSLTEGLLEAGEDSNVRVVVLTGKGKAFSTGLDLSEVGKDIEPPKHGVPGLFNTLVDFPKPLLLAINGFAVGLGRKKSWSTPSKMTRMLSRTMAGNCWHCQCVGQTT